MASEHKEEIEEMDDDLHDFLIFGKEEDLSIEGDTTKPKNPSANTTTKAVARRASPNSKKGLKSKEIRDGKSTTPLGVDDSGDDDDKEKTKTKKDLVETVCSGKGTKNSKAKRKHSADSTKSTERTKGKAEDQKKQNW